MATQNFTAPSSTDPLGLAILTHLVDRDDALRANFSGSSAPSSTAAFQTWADTSAGMMKLRNAANNGWISLFPLAAQVPLVLNLQHAGAMAAKELQIVAPVAMSVSRIVLVTDTTTSGSVAATNEWTFLLRNVTQAVNLFSATPSTATTVAGVGGGEITADTAYSLTANQNAAVSSNDVLRLTIAQTGSPTAVADVSIVVIGYPLGA